MFFRGPGVVPLAQARTHTQHWHAYCTHILVMKNCLKYDRSYLRQIIFQLFGVEQSHRSMSCFTNKISPAFRASKGNI